MENITLPTKLYTAAQVRELDKLAQKLDNLADGELMERAGLFLHRVLQEVWPAARHFVIVTGSGNNGGDGYVIARLLQQNNQIVRVLAVGEPEKLTGDAVNAYNLAVEAGVLISPWDAESLTMADVIVDALLGTGLKRKIDGIYADVIKTINASEIPVLAIDIPSGLSADNGRALGVAIHANVTATFIGLKRGLCTGEAADYVGEIIFSNLGASDYIYDRILPSAYRLHPAQIEQAFKPRARTAHKGDFGHVLIIGGDYGFAGAAGMAATAALRIGAGLMSVATRPEHIPALVAMHPEIMVHGITNAEQLDPLLARATVIVLGPGLGRSEWSKQLWIKAVASHLPMVVDADGLNLLAEDHHISREWILTPHLGEAARLLKTSVDSINLDRFHAALDLQHEYGGIAVLKGSGTIIQTEEPVPFICTAGNPGMASGGMGDVLSGIIGGLIAQKFSLPEAAEYGVYIHARAADLASRQGERGMIATDLMPYIRELVNPV